jgi:outer membrane protein assembly factor BamB
MNGRVYIIDDAGEGINEQERVVCFDVDTGKPIWEHRFNIFLTDIVSARVGWTNLAGDPETGNVYAHGVQGLFFCFNKDGKVLWSHSLTEEYGRISGYGGRVNSPIVDGDLVIMGMPNASWGEQARGANRFLAFDKRTGQVVWWSQPSDVIRGTYYSIPVVAVINGQRLLITGGSDGAVHALKVRTGEPVWSYTISAKAINTSPVVDGTRVYIAHGEENLDTTEMGRVVCLDAGKVTKGKPELVWKVDGITDKFVSPIFHDGRLYLCNDEGKMYCFDGGSGSILWTYKYGRDSAGSPVWADGKIYVGEVGARFHILKPEPNGCKELHSQFFRSTDGTTSVEINGNPAVANGRIYFTTTEAIYCIGKKDHKNAAATVPPGAQESAADPSAKPAHLLIYPADVVLEPGQSVELKARAFDSEGHFLKEVKADWSLVGMLPPPAPPNAPPPATPPTPPPPLKGDITAEGKLTVDKTTPAQFGGVVAKAEGLTTRARVRVVPRLPYQQDFEKVAEGRTPPGWINAQGKFAVVNKGGSKALKKLANNSNPLLARAYAFIGMPSLTNYTIQADLLGVRKRGELPDMGLVANRYTLFLDGNKQRLRIVSWEALPRVDKTIPWEWKPDAWYRMKLSVEVQGDKALLRGKVWERDKQEPADWTIEFEDPTPNREGSPALYGYATAILENEPGTEIFYENVSVTPNKR